MFNEFSEAAGGSIPDLTVPSKEALIHLLRNESKWPEGFKFNFNMCSTCAMGLATAAWPNAIKIHAAENVGNAIGIKWNDANRIFLNGDGRDFRTISAHDVADMLEAV